MTMKSSSSLFHLLMWWWTMALLSTCITTILAETEPYVYIIYYSDGENCGKTTTGVIPIVPDEDLYWFGAVDVQDALCSQEVLCLVNSVSDQCQSLNMTKDGITQHNNVEGGVFQCDSTNTDGDCTFLQVTGCYDSSLFPNCNFKTVQSAAILADPSLIANDNPVGLEDSSYMVFYNDADCTEWAGLKGVTSGRHDFPYVTDTSVSCADAMACTFFPEGDKCQSLSKTETTTRILTQVNNDGQTEECNEAGVCTVVDSTACTVSTLAPSCHVRWVSTTELVSNPDLYITEGGGDQVGTPKDNDATPEPTSDATTMVVTGSRTLMGCTLLAALMLI